MYERLASPPGAASVAVSLERIEALAREMQHKDDEIMFLKGLVAKLSARVDKIEAAVGPKLRECVCVCGGERVWESE